MKSISQIEIENKTVLIRVDYNVPIIDGAISNTFRIDSSLKTIKYCLGKNCKVVLISHLGRPKGIDKKYSLRPVFDYLKTIFGDKIFFSDDCLGSNTLEKTMKMNQGEIHLLENLRFYPDELNCDKVFSEKLSKHGNIFINEAFGTAHRSHASNVGVSSFFSQKAYGFLISKEIDYLDRIINKEEGKIILLLGGAKISDKIKLISRFRDIADKILIGGAMSNNFLKAAGLNVGKSLIESDAIALSKDILNKSKSKIVLPLDFVSTKDISDDKNSIISCYNSIDDDDITVDIGPETISLFKHIISKANCVIWNGPMGIIEKEKFSLGTKEIINLIMDMTTSGATTIIGGGDTSSMIDYRDFDKFSHISTGGGASLRLLGGESMPAIDALK